MQPTVPCHPTRTGAGRLDQHKHSVQWLWRQHAVISVESTCMFHCCDSWIDTRPLTIASSKSNMFNLFDSWFQPQRYSIVVL